MFAPLPDAGTEWIGVTIDGEAVRVPRGSSAAAAMLMHTDGPTRTTPVSGEGRAPYCMMGVCFECLMVIDGEPNQQGCLVLAQEGMRIERQHGKRSLGK